MLRSTEVGLTVKVWGIHAVSPEEKERLWWEGFAEKELGFKSGMNERVGDGKLIIISVIVQHKRPYKIYS